MKLISHHTAPKIVVHHLVCPGYSRVERTRWIESKPICLLLAGAAFLLIKMLVQGIAVLS